jgi:hypothetical protein
MSLLKNSLDGASLLSLIPPEALIVALKIHRLRLYEFSSIDEWSLNELNVLNDLAAYTIGSCGLKSPAGREAQELSNLITWVKTNR